MPQFPSLTENFPFLLFGPDKIINEIFNQIYVIIFDEYFCPLCAAQWLALNILVRLLSFSAPNLYSRKADDLPILYNETLGPA